MKKYPILFIASLLSIAALSACGSKANSSDSNSSNNSGTSEVISDSHSDGSDDTSSHNSSTSNKRVSLKIFGKLYLSCSRTIYAIKENMDDELVWSSSNPDVIVVSKRSDLDSEATLVAMSEGRSTIRVSSISDSTVYAEKEIVVEKGTKMPSSLYSTIKSGVKMTSKVSYLNFDHDLDSTIDSSETVTTVYEETDPDSTVDPNYTDAYQIDVINDKTHQNTFSRKYVRGTGGYVSTETVDYKNEVISKKYFDNDHEEGIKFNTSYYINFFAYSSYISEDDFETFDNGRTYQYVGHYVSSTALLKSIFMSEITANQLYFTVENNQIKSFTVDVDPYNKTATDDIRYGYHSVTTFSDIGSATIDHLLPYEHKSEHDALDTAKDLFKTCKNYTVNYSLDFDNDNENDADYTYIFTEDGIDTIIKQNNVIINHQGIVKTETGYSEYSYNDSTQKVTITKTHTQGWNDVNRYPTFDFASEVFSLKNGKYVAFEDAQQFFRTCFYLPIIFSYASSSDGYIKLNDTKISEIGARFKYEDEVGSFIGTFSNYNSSSIDIDFSNIGEDEDHPTSFKEANPTLYENMKNWECQDDIPYLYSSAGYDNSVYFLRDSSLPSGVAYIMIDTKKFETSDARDKFIADYKKLLLDSGYTYNEEDKINDLPSYTKGDYSFAVDAKRFYNGTADLAVRIYARNAKFNIDMYYR